MNKPKDPIKRFFKFVTKTKACWIWKGNGKKFYGIFHIGPHPRHTMGPHRFSYLIHVGPIPKGHFVCHHCDNMRCVNPKHLFIGTQKQNMKDKVKKGRQAKGSKHGMSKLKENDVKDIRKLAQYTTNVNIAKKYNISPRMVGLIVNRNNWKSL